MKFRIWVCLLFFMLPMSVFAQDQDDTVIRGEDLSVYRLDTIAVSSEHSKQLMERHPEQVTKIEAFLRAHYEHANNRDFDAYMGDFVSRISQRETHQRYAKKVMALPQLQIEILGIDFQELSRNSAVVHVYQQSRYENEGFLENIESIVSFRLTLENNTWKINYSERKRLNT